MFIENHFRTRGLYIRINDANTEYIDKYMQYKFVHLVSRRKYWWTFGEKYNVTMLIIFLKHVREVK